MSFNIYKLPTLFRLRSFKVFFDFQESETILSYVFRMSMYINIYEKTFWLEKADMVYEYPSIFLAVSLGQAKLIINEMKVHVVEKTKVLSSNLRSTK